MGEDAAWWLLFDAGHGERMERMKVVAGGAWRCEGEVGSLMIHHATLMNEFGGSEFVEEKQGSVGEQRSRNHGSMNVCVLADCPT